MAEPKSTPIEVEVTGELVQFALQQHNSRCAIALALKNASEDFVLPFVDQETIRVTDVRTGKRYIFRTPEQIAKWIDAFDNQRAKAKPFRFDLILDQADEVRPMTHMTVGQAIRQTERDKVRRNKQYAPAASVSRSERKLR